MITLLELARLGMKMREAQKLFFRLKSHNPFGPEGVARAQALSNAIALEARFDEAVRAVAAGQKEMPL